MSDQINLAALGLPTISEESLKLIKKLSKLTGMPESEYTSWSEKDLNTAFEAEKSRIENLKKLKDNLKSVELEYDDNLSFDENQSIFNLKHKELKEAKQIEEDRAKNPKYKYPFRIYFKGCDIQEPDHIFETEKEYTAKEIVSALFKAGYKEFSGNVNLQYDSSDNMMIPEFTSQKHG